MEKYSKEQWEIAKYLIDAKKAVDSLWYIANNVNELKNLDLRKKTQEKKREFYINCRIVLEKAFPLKRERMALRDSDPVIKAILTEANQNYAHKDARYRTKPMNSWEEMLKELSGQLRHLRKVCANALPDGVTLNFVPHDKEFFRYVQKISPEDEEEIKKARHPLYGNGNPDPANNTYPALRVLHDIEQVKEEEGFEKQYAVIVENGLNFYEGLQNRQDWCILSNYQFGTKKWVIMDKIKLDKHEECHCYSGKKYKNCCAEGVMKLK